MVDTALACGRGLLLGLCSLLLGATTVEAPPLAAAVKATYLYKLPQFVTWPAEAFAGNSFVICVYGAVAFRDVVADAARGETLHGLPVEVRLIDAGGDPRPCQVMYFPPGRASPLLTSLRGTPILTVTDDDPAPPGGVVDFIVRGGHVRFAVDLQAAAADRLSISSKLLGIALRVTGEPLR